MTHNVVKDDGALFQVVPATRKIAVPTSHKIIGTVGDHNSEEITFQCPVTVDGHEVMNCAEHYVIFKNALGISYRADIPPEDVISDDEYIYLTWVIDKRVTASAGQVTFSLFFVDKDASDTVIYKWGTTACSDCMVLDSVIDDTDPPIPEGFLKPEGIMTITENGTYMVTEYAYAVVDVVSSGGLPELEDWGVDMGEIPNNEEGYYYIEAEGIAKGVVYYRPHNEITNQKLLDGENGCVKVSSGGYLSAYNLSGTGVVGVFYGAKMDW